MNIAAARNEDLKRAVEALRNGVPNRDAVQFLGCGQTNVEEGFRRQLSEVEPGLQQGLQSTGMLVAGGFGAGKSHLLEYLQHIALEQNFVCSRVVISKETPLYDPVKMYEAAVESAVLPKSNGQAIQEVAIKLNQDSPRYAELFAWANSEESGLAPIFPATLLLRERLGGDPELSEEISAFWGGAKLPVARVRGGLRQIGQAATFSVKAVPVKELALQRLRFAPRLMRAAGYRGWVILIDEVELIGRYTRLQRGRSYAELARWMGLLEGDQYCGLTAVAAIHDSFESYVLNTKGDRDEVGPRLRDKGTDEFNVLAARAETGMRVIEKALSLVRPDDDTLARTYSTLKDLHGRAYDWQTPDVPSADRSILRPMRSYVRRWINEWDLKRLYPNEELHTEEDEITVDYTENADLTVNLEDADPTTAAE
jgi:hypothetical protein